MRIAVVGTGGVASRHLGVLAQLGGLEVAGHVSRDLARAEAQAGRWGGRAYADLEALVERERPEAVWLCVTPDQHGPLEAALIERGLPFFVEKPLAADLATAERTASLLRQRPVITAVGYKLRALDTLPLVRDLLAERPARLALAAWHDAMPSPAWWRIEARSGGQVVEQATHLVDLARLLVGEAEVVSALASRRPRAAAPEAPEAPEADVADVSAALLRFRTRAGEVPGVLTATCLLEGKQAAHLQLVCEGRVLTIAEQTLRIESGRDRREVPVRLDPFQEEDRAFVQAIRQQDPTQVLCSYRDALDTHRLCCAIRDAATQAGTQAGPTAGGRSETV